MAQLAPHANDFVRRHDRLHAVARRLTFPVRQTPVPIVLGNGRGLRVRVGPSTLMRIVATVERDVEDVFIGLLQPGNVVYDIGANIGWYTLLAGRQVGPSGSVIAFEPMSTNAIYLRRNAVSNNLDNITIIPSAVGDRNGWATFSAGSSLGGKLSDNGSLAVPILSLDSWIAETGQRPPQVLKIDVEGAEGSVLRGMFETLRAAQPTLIIELHGTNAEVADLLERAGYTHHPVDHEASTRNAPWWVHVLARP